MADDTFPTTGSLELGDDAKITAEFVTNLKRLRNQAGLSQNGLAWRSSFSRETVSALEGGGRTPRLTTIIKLAGSLGVKPSALAESAPATPRPLFGPELPRAFYTAHRRKWRPDPLVGAALQFGENLRRIRHAAGGPYYLTQVALAERVGLHRTEVSLLERGLREPRLTTIVKLSRYLKTDIDRLAEGIHWPLRPSEAIVPGQEPPRHYRHDKSRLPTLGPSTDDGVSILTFHQQVGSNLRALRKRSRLSQARLSERAGASKDTITKTELGRRNPALGTLIKIAAVLRVPPSSFTQGIRWRAPDPTLSRFQTPGRYEFHHVPDLPAPAGEPLDCQNVDVVSLKENFARNLVAARTTSVVNAPHFLSQETLAWMCGIHPGEIFLLEKARRGPRIGTVIRLAGSLDVPIDKLIEGTEFIIIWRDGSRELGGYPVGFPGTP